jgi:tetratricopeptide (TPR) repeat protein
MKVKQKIITILVVAVISSCTTVIEPPHSLNPQRISTEVLLDASPLASGVELPDLSHIDVLELSPLMIAFLDRWVDLNQGDYFKLRSLVYAVMGDGTFKLVYDDSTRTAQETFLDQRGNCLSFTSMFVAMSRYLGLKANFQEVIVPPDWSVKGSTLILSKHVNVHVNMDAGDARRHQIVDFNMYDFRSSYDMHIVSDRRGRAHYFNNMGVERMLEGNIPMALANFRESLREDKSFTPAWVNLGILYSREDYPQHAEAAYLIALEADSSNLVAMSNLAGLYEQQGHSELAAQYQLRIESHRMRNPYYRYQLARTAFEEGEYTAAVDHLKFAIRKNKNDDSFYFLMSLSYLNSGDRESAQRWMRKAEKVAEMDADKKKYHNKIDLLMSSGRDG